MAGSIEAVWCGSSGGLVRRVHPIWSCKATWSPDLIGARLDLWGRSSGDPRFGVSFVPMGGNSPGAREIVDDTTDSWTARRVVRTLDWLAFRRVFLDNCATDDDIVSMEGSGLLNVDAGETSWSGGLCWGASSQRIDAVEAYRDEVAALGKVARRVRALARHSTPWAYFPHVHGTCAAFGVVRRNEGHAELTGFGREVARVLANAGQGD